MREACNLPPRSAAAALEIFEEFQDNSERVTVRWHIGLFVREFLLTCCCCPVLRPGAMPLWCVASLGSNLRLRFTWIYGMLSTFRLLRLRRRAALVLLG
jgi:hypothetical protein